MHDKIQNLIFDYGGIIVNIHDTTVAQAFADLGIPLWKRFVNRHTIRRLMHEYIDGLRPTDDVVAEIAQHCGPHVTKEKVYAVLKPLTGELPPSRPALLKSLRPHYHIILLSNINEILWQSAVDQLAAVGYRPEDCFDEIYLSYQLRLAKPDPRIFSTVIQQAAIDPAATLYFDDRQDNVVAGQQAGLHAIYVPSNHLEESPVLSQLLPH